MVDQRRFDHQRWVDAQTAAEHLGIQVRSLYAYVSRGQVRSVPGEKGRPRLYALADLERLRVRRDARAGHGAVAAGALRWGEPVMDSAITAITPRGPAYRGRLATELAATGTPFENVAELLWSGYLPEEPIAWPRVALPLAAVDRVVQLARGASDAGAARRLVQEMRADREPSARWSFSGGPDDDAGGIARIAAMQLLVSVAALGDRGRDPRPDAVIARGRRIIPMLAAALVPDLAPAPFARAMGAGSVAAACVRALGIESPGFTGARSAAEGRRGEGIIDDARDAVRTIDAVLVLLADHELNASSFTARVAASTGADPYACVAAALATVSGGRHGAACEEVARFAAGIADPDGVRPAVRALRRRGEQPPGFGHPLYPGGDPRAAPMLAAARALAKSRREPMLQVLLALADAVDEPANVDLALAALVAALGAPPAAGSGLFAVARCAGWLAHALEQRASGALLRPRARYVGPPVTS